VVPLADVIKGKVPVIYVSLKPGFEPSKEIQQKVIDSIVDTIGKIARPRHVYIVPDMPKTRSGKIMRRVLASITNRVAVGDVTTLANPEIVGEVKKLVEESL
jgi:acetyl-CoA synthetase